LFSTLLGLESQAKLLRAVETHVFRPIGARADRRSDFRVIAATNADVDRLAADGRFRPDLLHRLSAGAVLRVPALREHPEDIALLACHFAGQAALRLEREVRLDRDAIARLCAHEWPGNVRELRAVIDRAAVLSDKGSLDAHDVEIALAAAGGNGAGGHSAMPRPNAAVQPLSAVVRAAEAAAIAAALAHAGGDRALAAGLLDISVATLTRRLARLRRGGPEAQI
jgi:DNA-binding NtrC family response regulator